MRGDWGAGIARRRQAALWLKMTAVAAARWESSAGTHTPELAIAVIPWASLRNHDNNNSNLKASGVDRGSFNIGCPRLESMRWGAGSFVVCGNLR